MGGMEVLGKKNLNYSRVFQSESNDFLNQNLLRISFIFTDFHKNTCVWIYF